MKDNVINKIMSIISIANGNKHNISENTCLEDLELDSITFIQIIVDIEESFGIEFSMEDLSANNFKSISDIINRVLALEYNYHWQNK